MSNQASVLASACLALMARRGFGPGVPIIEQLEHLAVINVVAESLRGELLALIDKRVACVSLGEWMDLKGSVQLLLGRYETLDALSESVINLNKILEALK
ncbi:MAG: hypothetical protein ACRC8D_07215 [Aeromonas sp.]